MQGDRQTYFSTRSGTSPLPGAVGISLNGRARIVEWFRRWRGPIRCWIAGNKCVSSAEADDLTQEVFMRLLRYSDDLMIENPQGYLFRVACNVVHAWRKRCSVRMPHDDVGLEELRLEAAQEPENVCARDDQIRRVHAAVDRLPTRQRELLWLHVNEEMTYKQIAQERGLTYRIVVRDLSRAYAVLREQLLSQYPASPDLRTGRDARRSGKVFRSLRGTSFS